MFGKSYDEEIKDLYKKLNDVIKMQNENQETLLWMIKDNQELINKFENSLLEVAKVQKSHKEAIILLSKKIKLE